MGFTASSSPILRFCYALAALCLIATADAAGFVPSSSSLTHVPKSNTSPLFYLNDHGLPPPFEKKTGKERTLYDILGAQPTASRDELKARYVQLAKYSHPDAQIGFKIKKRNAPSFGEIAAAWRVLSDAESRAKYDRGLKLQKWSDDAAEATLQALEDAAPKVANFLETMAGPFMERAAISVSKAVAEAMSSSSDRSAATTTSDSTSALEEGTQETVNAPTATRTGAFFFSEKKTAVAAESSTSEDAEATTTNNKSNTVMDDISELKENVQTAARSVTLMFLVFMNALFV